MATTKRVLNMGEEERQLLAQRFNEALADLTPAQREELIAGIEINIAKEAIDAVAAAFSAKDKEEIDKIMGMDIDKGDAKLDDIDKEWRVGSIGAVEALKESSKIVSPEIGIKVFDYCSENVKEFIPTYKELLIKKLERLEEIRATYIAESKKHLKK